MFDILAGGERARRRCARCQHWPSGIEIGGNRVVVFPCRRRGDPGLPVRRVPLAEGLGVAGA
eukprot:7116811-Alexandrium_andersonii.AAC.1